MIRGFCEGIGERAISLWQSSVTKGRCLMKRLCHGDRSFVVPYLCHQHEWIDWHWDGTSIHPERRTKCLCAELSLLPSHWKSLSLTSEPKRPITVLLNHEPHSIFYFEFGNGIILQRHSVYRSVRIWSLRLKMDRSDKLDRITPILKCPRNFSDSDTSILYTLTPIVSLRVILTQCRKHIRYTYRNKVNILGQSDSDRS